MDHEPKDNVTVERQVEVPAAVETVWKRVSDSTMISDWMGGDVEIEPVAGGRITFHPEGGPEVWGTVEDVVKDQRIQWSWRTDDGLPSLIEIELSPGTDETSTLVTVRETLLPWRVSGPDGYTEWPDGSLSAEVAVGTS